MNAPTEEQLDLLAERLIRVIHRFSEYGWTEPEPELRHRPGVLYCARCGGRLRDHTITGGCP